MKKIQELSLKPDEIFGNYGIEWEEPLLEYVEIIAQKYHPPTYDAIEYGQFISRAINDFAHRYLAGKVDVSSKQKYLEEENIQKTILAMGYDFHKFWYLLMFIRDYSTGFCVKGIKPKESAKEQITKVVDGIFSNIKALDNDTGELSFFQPAKIVLEVHGKRKIIIDNPVAFPWLVSTLHKGLKEVEVGSKMDVNFLQLKVINGHLVGNPESNSIHIWYFGKMFLDFFDLKPPIKSRQKKGDIISTNKKHLVSRLIYLTQLSLNKKFLDSEDTLKRYLKKHEKYQLELINGYYLI